MPKQNRWTELEYYLCMHLYHRTPFGRQDKSNPEIIALAHIIGKTPSAVSMRLCNFSHYDPIENARGIKGLDGGGKMCESFWNRFQDNFTEESIKAEYLWGKYVTNRESIMDVSSDIVITPFSGETETAREVKQRLGQNFFRTAILSLYNNKCCITGVPLKELLIASHIKPWATYEKERTNPANGLCLSRLHDSAFDKGLITFDEDYRLVLSKSIKEVSIVETISDCFEKFEGKTISLPEKNLPSLDALEWHRENLFVG